MYSLENMLDFHLVLNTISISCRFSIKSFPQGHEVFRNKWSISGSVSLKRDGFLLHKDLSCAILFTWDCLLTSSFNESRYFYYHAVHSIGFNTLLHLIINKVQRYPPLSHTDLPAKHSFETSSYLKLFFTVWINTVLAVDALCCCNDVLPHEGSCCCLHSSCPNNPDLPTLQQISPGFAPRDPAENHLLSQIHCSH